MSTNRSRLWPAISVIISILILVIALPQNRRTWFPSFLQSPKIHYGLDLVGGTQLDFRISEREMIGQISELEKEISRMENEGAPPDSIGALRAQLNAIREQQKTIVEAIKAVLERRINSMGVSEAVITPSYVGNEKHLLVECPGVVETQACIDTVGKTISLEFKEEYTEATEEFEKGVRGSAEETAQRIKKGELLSVIGEDMSSELGTGYENEKEYFFDQLPKSLEQMWDRKPSQGVKKIEGSIEVPRQTEEGHTIQEVPGIFLSEVTKPREKRQRALTDISLALEHLSKTMENASLVEIADSPADDPADPIIKALGELSPGGITSTAIDETKSSVIYLKNRTQGSQEMEASHILVSFKGALSAPETVTRAKEEAKKLAEEIKSKIEGGERFEDLVKKYSDGPSAKEGGSLGRFGLGTMVPAFEQAAFALKDGEISSPVETQFGFHIIRADKAPVRSPDILTYDILTFFNGAESLKSAENALAQIKENRVQREEEVVFLRNLFFSLIPTGWKDTALDGKHFRSATVTLDPTTNLPVVQILFDAQGGQIFQELTKKNVGKRIAIFVGGELVSAPTVQAEISGGTAIITGSRTFEDAKKLAQDLNTGAIPAPIYLAGQYTVEATLGAQALVTSIKATLIGTAVLMLFMIAVYRLMGFIADITLGIYALILVTLLKLPLFLFSDQQIVLTLAGIAGIILSVGMAVDANVLIFERIKEEMRMGKNYKTAVSIGFERAWPSIRDGNYSTLITCAILFIIGTSIVRGFAATLSMGILVSMFTAIVVTRWFMDSLEGTPLAENREMFGANMKHET